MIDQLVNTNTVLILLATGTIIWAVRQLLPERIESHKAWKIALRLLPIALGSTLSVVPQLRPMDNITQSVVIGGVAGSLSSSLYGILRESLGDRVKAVLGAKVGRQ